MRLGVMMFPTDKGIQPIELAKEAEARGFDSLWFPEHSHIPVSRRTPWGAARGRPLPEEYWRTHDQFVALGACAVTTNLKLGTGITLVAQRDPFWLAKEVATVDQLSEGRFLLGIGYGWNHEEMENHGNIDVKRRRALVREKMLACIELWTKDEASFSGQYVNFEPSWSWPKPFQTPHPPIVIGASPTPVHFRHIIEYGDMWMPIEGRWPILEKWNDLLREAAAADRDPDTLSLGIFGARPDSAHLGTYRDAGVRFVALGLPATDRDAALATMDKYAPLVEEFNA